MYRNPYSRGHCVHPSPCDHGPALYSVNVTQAARQNCAFRSALWTGCYLQMALMCIPVGGDVGVETHPHTDQYIRVEEGCCTLKTGCCKEHLDARQCMTQNDAVFIPAGTWHNLVNTGSVPLRLSSVYAPPQHPRGTVHKTREEAQAAEI